MRQTTFVAVLVFLIVAFSCVSTASASSGKVLPRLPMRGQLLSVVAPTADLPVVLEKDDHQIPLTVHGSDPHPKGRRLHCSIPEDLQDGPFVLRVGDKVVAKALRIVGPHDQQDVRVELGDEGTLTFGNSHYRAAFGTGDGLLQSMTRSEQSLIGSESVRVDGNNREATDAEWTVLETSPFYSCARWLVTLKGGLTLERWVEATRGPHLYVTDILTSDEERRMQEYSHAFELPKGSKVQEPFTAEAPWGKHARRVTHEGRPLLDYGKIQDDLWIETPSAPWGGFADGLFGVRFDAPIHVSKGVLRDRRVKSGKLGDTKTGKITCAAQKALVSSRVFSATEASTPTAGYRVSRTLHRLQRNPFYTGLGQLAESVNKKNEENYYTFINWNRLEYTAELVPPEAAELGSVAMWEDALLRTSFYLRERLRYDKSWLRWFRWHKYERGAHFTAHARAFNGMIYTVARLAQVYGAKAPHVSSYFRSLDSTSAFFNDKSPLHFWDRTKSGIEYLSYAAELKEKEEPEVAAVANTHAQAVRYSVLMRDLSRRLGRQRPADKWDAIVQRAHPGSVWMLENLHPATRDQDGGDSFIGLLSYRRTDRRVINMAYNGISLSGLADSYRAAHDGSPQFIEFVERAHHDYDPFDSETKAEPRLGFLGQIYRTEPLTLAFIPKETREIPMTMVRDLRYASLDEVLAAKAPLAKLSPSKYLLIDTGTQVRTNNPISLEMVEGSTATASPSDIPEDRQFDVTVLSSPTKGEATWAAVHRGTNLQVVTSLDQSHVRVSFTVPSGHAATRQVLRYQGPGWKKEMAVRFKKNTKDNPLPVDLEIALDRKDVLVITFPPLDLSD